MALRTPPGESSVPAPGLAARVRAAVEKTRERGLLG